MRILIRNTFHNTETYTDVGADLTITKDRRRGIRRRLCGMRGCTCGGDLSERGDSRRCAIGDRDGRPLMFTVDSSGGGVFEYV